MFNSVKLFLFFLMSILQITPTRCVKRFKMKSCGKNRNVTFVFGFYRFNDFSPIYYKKELFYYRQLRRTIEKYNNGRPCFSISLAFVSTHGIVRMTDDNEILPVLPLDDGNGKFGEISLNWSKYFLEQYQKEVDGSQDKLLVFYDVDISRALIKELNELRKVTPVILTLQYNYPYEIFYALRKPIDFPLRQVTFFPDFTSGPRDQYCQTRQDFMHQYLLPAVDLIQNPVFDRFKFIEETPYEKNVSCLRNTSIVWPIEDRFNLRTKEKFHLFSLHEIFLVVSKKLNLPIYTFTENYKSYDEANLLDFLPSIINKKGLFTDLVKVNYGNNPSIRSYSLCQGKNNRKIVYIIDELSMRSHKSTFYSLLNEKNKCFVQIGPNVDECRGRYPYRKQNVMYYSREESNPYKNLNLLFDALIDIGC